MTRGSGIHQNSGISQPALRAAEFVGIHLPRASNPRFFRFLSRILVLSRDLLKKTVTRIIRNPKRKRGIPGTRLAYAWGYDARGALGNMPSPFFDRLCYINATSIHE